MNAAASGIWLPLYGLFYIAVALYWARVAAIANGNHETFFSAGHSLPSWMAAVLMAGASLSGWFLLGGSAEIASHGFSLPAVLQAGVALALPGTLFFKRMWFVCQRLRLSSQAELFRSYYDSSFLVVVSTAIAVLFAVAFAGLQLRALSGIISALSDGTISPLVAGTVLGVVLFATVAIGGMRAVGYLGTIQAVLAFAAFVGFAGYILLASGGFAGLNGRLLELATDPASVARFTVAGVIQFSAGLGRSTTADVPVTAVTSLSLALAFMGFQASPVAAKIVLSTRDPRGLAAGQTWVMAGAVGGLIVFATAIVGAAGLADSRMSIAGVLLALRDVSPWFMAWLVIGVVAAVQLLAGLALLTAGEALVRTIYKPYFHSTLSRRDTVNLCRIVIGLLALGSVLLQALTPVTLSALGAVALPLSFQLWTPLLGITWLKWITRPAATVGVGFGIAGVLLTEPLGYEILSFLGLELPWGRWPWTIHSAAWGMAANLAAVLIISAITHREALGEEAREVRRFLATTLRLSPSALRLTSVAWSVGLIWLFFAIGPGLVFGNFAFGQPGVGRGWLVGMPSIWAWSALFWALGVGLIWFLSYKMEMASPVSAEIAPYQPRPRLRPDQSALERQRLRALIITGALGFGLIVLIALGFGR